MRFTDAPFDNPFRTAQSPAPARDPATTGSIGRVASAPLQPIAAAPAVRAQPLPPPQSAVALSTAPAQPVAGSANGWSAQGGTPVVVAQGENLDVISSRYGVPRAAIISVNGLSSPNVAPGSRIVIPVYNGGGAPAAAAVAAAPAAPARAETHRFVAGPPAARPAAAVAEAKSKAQAAAEARQAAAEAKAAAAAEAKAKAAADAQAMREARARFAAEAKAKADARKAGAAARPLAEAKPAAVQQPARVATPVQQPAKPVAVASAPAVEPRPAAIPKAEPEPKTTASLPKADEDAAGAADKADFRWPARGRVISGYSKGGNEGINIAVPEGTPVKAAEGGTVAYAGSELKGYGNLVLIRHPNGYVSAYAHNGELKVKRGDTVKRGQVVASSGQTGNVSSPQLHFELRKGSTPVDPTPYLNN